MRYTRPTYLTRGLAAAGLAALIFWPYRASFSQALNPGLSSDERDQLTRELDALEREAAEIDKNIQKTQGEARTLKNEIKLLDNGIKRSELEIKRLALVIRQTQSDIGRKVASIKTAEAQISNSQKKLAAAVQAFSRQDSDNLLEVMLRNENLSEFFLALNNYEQIQKDLKNTLDDLRQYKVNLEKQKQELEEYQKGQEDLKSIQEVNRRELNQKRSERNQLLQLTQGKESLFQELLKKKKTDIAAIKSKLFYLEQAGISAEEALATAKLAAGRTGIRPAFLLALLEVETGKQFEDGQITVGANVGTGNWQRDMYQCYVNLGKTSAAEAQKRAFFQITAELGLDPDKMPVSRKPSYGCGGAMGPAQFIPTTWLLFKDKVAAVTGRGTPNPWNVEDSFTAAAIFLADSGADSKGKSGEISAARTYISGKASCPSGGSARAACISYANRVYSLSQEIERAL